MPEKKITFNGKYDEVDREKIMQTIIGLIIGLSERRRVLQCSQNFSSYIFYFPISANFRRHRRGIVIIDD